MNNRYIESLKEVKELLSWIDLAMHLLFKEVRIIVVDKLPYGALAMTDGKRVFFSEEYFTLNKEERTLVMMHELMHIIFLHPDRAVNIVRDETEHKIWNMACDTVVNLRLQNIYKISTQRLDKLFRAVDVERLLPRFDVRARMDDSAEEIYSRLMKDVEKVVVYVDDLKSLFDVISGKMGDELEKEGTIVQDGSEDMLDDNRRKMKIIEIVYVGKSAGTGVGKMAKDIEGALKPKLSWKLVLRSSIHAEIKKNVVETWSRINRRNGDMPAYRGVGKPYVWALVDVSGSVWDVVYEFISELYGILREGAKINVVFWDSGIRDMKVVSDVSQLPKKIVGGGGTEIAEVLEYVEKHIKRNDILVVFTDGYWFDEKEAVSILNRIGNKKILATIGRVVDGFDIVVKMK